MAPDRQVRLNWDRTAATAGEVLDEAPAKQLGRFSMNAQAASVRRPGWLAAIAIAAAFALTLGMSEAQAHNERIKGTIIGALVGAGVAAIVTSSGGAVVAGAAAGGVIGNIIGHKKHKRRH